jgi:hypothetical protein
MSITSWHILLALAIHRPINPISQHERQLRFVAQFRS